MVETIIGAIASVIASLGASAGVATAIATGITLVLSAGVSLGLSYLSSLFTKKPGANAPKPEDVQQQTRQAVSARRRHYGRVKASGNWVFAESQNGAFYKAVVIGQGPIDTIEEFWIDDTLVFFDSGGNVLGPDPFRPINGNPIISIESRTGQSSQVAFSLLTTQFAEWTSNHKGNGLVSICAVQRPVSNEIYLKTFPNGINTNYRVVLRGVLVENPVSLAVTWSDNAASIIRDYLYHPEGLRLPKSLLTTPQAVIGWQAAYNRAGDLIPLAAGGTEQRYRLWGTYSLEERPADVLNRMLVSCDGRLMITNDGGLTLDVGGIPEDLVTIDETMITGFSELGRGRDILTTANTIRATFTNPAQDYQSSDADPWVNTADAELRGEITQDVDFIMTPSHSQCRRLMKLAAFRANPNWVASFNCNPKALIAYGERYCRISYPTFGIDETFEIIDFALNFDEKRILKSVTVRVQSMPAAAYSWDVTQEGIAPIYNTSSGTSSIPDVTNFSVVVQRKQIGEVFYPYALLSFDEPDYPLRTEAQGKKTSDTVWTSIGVSEGAGTAESFLLEDGEEYEFQVRYRSISVGEWSDSVIVTAVADPIAPGVITALVVTPDDANDEVDLSWQSPNSSNFAATNIYRNTVDDFGTATLIRTEYGAANFPFTYTDASGIGTFFYWLKARNYSGVESAAVESGEITVV